MALLKQAVQSHEDQLGAARSQDKTWHGWCMLCQKHSGVCHQRAACEVADPSRLGLMMQQIGFQQLLQQRADFWMTDK